MYSTSCGSPSPLADVSGPPAGTSTVFPKTASGALVVVGSAFRYTIAPVALITISGDNQASGADGYYLEYYQNGGIPGYWAAADAVVSSITRTGDDTSAGVSTSSIGLPSVSFGGSTCRTG